MSVMGGMSGVTIIDCSVLRNGTRDVLENMALHGSCSGRWWRRRWSSSLSSSSTYCSSSSVHSVKVEEVGGRFKRRRRLREAEGEGVLVEMDEVVAGVLGRLELGVAAGSSVVSIVLMVCHSVPWQFLQGGGSIFLDVRPQ